MKIALRIAILLTLIIVVLILWHHEFEAAFRLFRDRITFPVAAGILFFGLVCFINEPLRWRFILKDRFSFVSFSKIYHLLTATALISYTLPARSGMPVRFFLSKKILGLDYATVGALLVVDSALLYSSWFVVAVLGGFLIIPQKHSFTMILGLGVIVSGIIILFCFSQINWSRFSRFKRLTRFAEKFSHGLKMLTVRVGVLNMLLLFSDIFFYGIRHSLILAGLGVQCSIFDVTLIVAISIFAGFISLMPLGLGGYDLSLVFLLTLIDVPKELALAVPVINRIVMIGVGLILGTFSMSRISLSHRTLVDASENSQLAEKVS